MFLEEKKKQSRMDKNPVNTQECVKERENVINGGKDEFGGPLLVSFSIKGPLSSERGRRELKMRKTERIFFY